MQSLLSTVLFQNIPGLQVTLIHAVIESMEEVKIW